MYQLSSTPDSAYEIEFLIKNKKGNFRFPFLYIYFYFNFITFPYLITQALQIHAVSNSTQLMLYLYDQLNTHMHYFSHFYYPDYNRLFYQIKTKYFT